jgi:hypothetical protein
MREIDEDYYCAGAFYGDGNCYAINRCKDSKCLRNKCCTAYRRKWETPAQYKERTGEELRDDAPVWSRKDDTNVMIGTLPLQWNKREWVMLQYQIVKQCDIAETVVATADWGKPPENWKPEEAQDA